MATGKCLNQNGYSVLVPEVSPAAAVAAAVATAVATVAVLLLSAGLFRSLFTFMQQTSLIESITYKNYVRALIFTLFVASPFFHSTYVEGLLFSWPSPGRWR